MTTRTVAEAFGPDAANKLALIAIDLLVEPPVEMHRATTLIPASMIRRGREILDDAGLDWKALKGTEHSGRHKRATE